jgi:hypothetical protein
MSVSTLIYSIREDLSEQTAQIERDRRRVYRAIVLVAVAIGPGVFVTDRLAGTMAWRSFLAEALSLCLYAAVAVWYGLRVVQSGAGERSRTAWHVALLVYVVGLIIMGLVDLGTKGSLRTPLVSSPQANDPILWAGALMIGFIPLLGWVAWRYPDRMSRVGLGFVRPLPNRWGEWGLAEARDLVKGVQTLALSRRKLAVQILAGLGVGSLIGAHFWLMTRTAGIKLDLKPWPYMAWQFFYEIGPQSLTEELFMRGVVFNYLYFWRGRNFWVAALMASSLELLSLLVKPDNSRDMRVILGVIFYTLASSIASAGLFRWSRSVVPGYVNNVVFSVVSMFR